MEKILIKENIKDFTLNINYDLLMFNSLELSDYLIKNLDDKGLDYKKFNSQLLDYANREVEIVLTDDIYEYQNFFLLEKENGVYILLDGFRRLLWNKKHNNNIYVRVYKEKDLDTDKIIKILISLNHSKFFGGIGSFYDRGFALAIYMLFNIDITKFKKSFNGYLLCKDGKYDYSISKFERADAIKEALNRMLKPSFISDLKFLEKFSEYMNIDEVFGGFIYKIGSENDIVFDSASLIEKIENNELLKKQIVSFEKQKDSRKNDIGNKMFEMFSNILLESGDKSYIEKEAETKAIVEALKKDKKWHCYSSKKLRNYDFWQNKTENNYGLDTIIKNFKTKEGVYPKVKVVVYPNKNGKDLLPYGDNDFFEIVGYRKQSFNTFTSVNVLLIKNGDIVIKNDKYDNHYDLSHISREEGEEYSNRIYKSNKVLIFIENIFGI